MKVKFGTFIYFKSYGGYEIMPLDYLITPFYVKERMRYELYAYELYIDIVEKKDFNKYLLKYTSKKSIEEIPKDIIDRHKNCYIDLLKGEYLEIKRLLNYIEYIFTSEEIKKGIEIVFSESCNNNNIFFAVY